MKKVTKLAAILIYLFIMSYLLDFELMPLFDLKQIFLVLTGMLILFIPGYRRGESMHDYAGQLARCAIFASYIQTFIMLFISLSTPVTLERLPKEAALSCRPLLYGICLWVIFSNEKKEGISTDNSGKQDEGGLSKTETSKAETAKTETPKADKGLPAAAAYEAYRKLGLTNREAELALLICKGLSNSEIAAELNISETTVKKHISNIFDKLGINSREQVLQCINPPDI